VTDQLFIQGKSVDSQNEMNVAIALDSLDMTYEYKYILGIMHVRGSHQIDFLVHTVPKPTPLFVHGEYWHTGKHALEDEMKMAEITSLMKNHWADPVIIWGENCETVEDAREAVREVLQI
jgi:hypothetical protein